MCQLTPSKIFQLTRTIPDSEKTVIDTDAVNFSIHTLKLGTIFPREMPSPGPNNLGLPYYISGGESDI